LFNANSAVFSYIMAITS